jgi:hypothetical protein
MVAGKARCSSSDTGPILHARADRRSFFALVTQARGTGHLSFRKESNPSQHGFCVGITRVRATPFKAARFRARKGSLVQLRAAERCPKRGSL